MIITAGTDGSFKLQTGGITVLTEGNEPGKGRAKPDIFLRMARTNTETPEAGPAPRSPQGGVGFTIKGPGEYEIQGIEIRGMEPFTYFLKAEDMRLVILSSANIAALDDLTNIDIALVPDHIINEADDASSPRSGTTVGRFLRQLEPRMIIATAKAAAQIGKDLGIVAEQTEKVTVKRRDIPSVGMKLTCLTA